MLHLVTNIASPQSTWTTRPQSIERTGYVMLKGMASVCMLRTFLPYTTLVDNLTSLRFVFKSVRWNYLSFRKEISMEHLVANISSPKGHELHDHIERTGSVEFHWNGKSSSLYWYIRRWLFVHKLFMLRQILYNPTKSKQIYHYLTIHNISK